MPVKHGQEIASDLKRQFALFSECELEGKAEIYFEQIERRGESVKVLVVDAFEDSIASTLWEQKAYLVSAARQVGLSRFCLIKCRGNRHGLAMMGVEDCPPRHGLAMMGVEDCPPRHGLTSNLGKEIS